MALAPQADPLPRIILYHQTIHDSDGNYVSILPLLTMGISVTHLIVAAIHINEDPDALTLNDHPPEDPRFDLLWEDLSLAQAAGVKVMGMLGGAAQGTYHRLDFLYGSRRGELGGPQILADCNARFERYYAPLKMLVRNMGLQGLDLDVEEPFTLFGIMNLIDRLRLDFGPDFIITLAPVAAALLNPRQNLSGFNYMKIEEMREDDIDWYNAQFYCGWGDASNTRGYELICTQGGWQPEKIVKGLLTSPQNGGGWVPFDVLGPTLESLQRSFPRFGGVMGWEYFNCHPGGQAEPWLWALQMTKLLRDTNRGTTNGGTASGEGANGEGASGEGANGEGANGEGANGEAANGEGANGEGANGATANGETANGETTNVETTSREITNSET